MIAPSRYLVFTRHSDGHTEQARRIQGFLPLVTHPKPDAPCAQLDLRIRRSAVRISLGALISDILWSNGGDLRHMPPVGRKALLRGVVRRSDHVFVADHVVGREVDLFREVCRRDCEGIVAKLAASPYRLLTRK